MDHGGQFEGEGRVMSQDQVDDVDFCDNLPISEAFTAQTQNLNETNTLTQSQSLSLLQKDDGGGHGLVPQASLGSNGKDTEKEWENKGGGGREEDEEEDIDEVMKEEQEEMSEGSSSLIRCHSPDALMTDSSYSETGSLLETPYPFSPGTSPEPASPVCAMLSPETAYPVSQVVLSQSDVKVESHTLKTESVASNTASITLGPTLTMGPVDSTAMLSETRFPCPRGTTGITEAKESIAKNTNSATEHFTSSTEPISSHGLTCASGVSSSYTGSKTFTVPSCTTTLNTSMDSTTMNATTGPLNITTAPMATSTDSISTTGLITSYLEQITSTPVPTCFSVSTCVTGPITNNPLLDALEQLAQRGDDTHLPQYLHQIAEAFVLQEDRILTIISVCVMVEWWDAAFDFNLC